MRSRERFNPRAPCGARHHHRPARLLGGGISTHAPLAGRDLLKRGATFTIKISTHAPLAGRDYGEYEQLVGGVISTHAPLAGRDGWCLASR